MRVTSMQGLAGVSVLVCVSCLGTSHAAAANDVQATNGFVEASGTRIYYEVAGEGPAVVLIHAGFLSSGMWDDQFERFAKRYRVIRYDVPPHGKSVLSEAPPAEHEQLAALLDHLGIERAALVGVSLGGAISLDFALVCPDRVDALVLVGSGVSGYRWSEQTVKLFSAVSTPDDFIGLPLYDAARENPRLKERLLELVKQNAGKAGAGAQPPPLDPPAVGRLAEIHAPTLILVGDRDMQDILDVADLLEKNIPGARRVTVAGAGHALNMERAEEFTRLVLDFFGGRNRSP